ncbi:DUF7507 domain-containing protein [Actinophytocola xanthii]|uniref:Uncharacterized protein n=1 Tax=Actinophytocola xanthii TaxID=1912961 RepID=A0A1Q8CPP2_9PSEU|nr:DUF11 domain-containing protein [Actinophytocola xanthii]OLF16316.1 hypothetical protein BU204_17165 [Actinophytocola xanthii]
MFLAVGIPAAAVDDVPVADPAAVPVASSSPEAPAVEAEQPENSENTSETPVETPSEPAEEPQSEPAGEPAEEPAEEPAPGESETVTGESGTEPDTDAEPAETEESAQPSTPDSKEPAEAPAATENRLAASADLAVTKSGPEAAAPASAITWQITVTNNGPETAGSFTLVDNVPAVVTGVVSTTPGCSVVGNAVTCTGGPLASGQQATIQITGTTPANFTFPLINTATASVGPGDTDPNTANNSGTAITTTATPAPSLGLVALALLQDTNHDDYGTLGETVRYTVTVTNTGNVTLTNLEVRHNGEVITCAATVLPVRQGTTCTVPNHVITAEDVEAGQVVTTTRATATAPNGQAVQSPESVTNIPVFQPIHRLGLVKRAALVDANGNGVADIGEAINYSFTVNNFGNVTLTGLRVVDPSLTGVTCQQASIVPGTPVRCTSDAPHITDADDVAEGQVVNSAFAQAAAPGGAEVVSHPSATNTPTISATPGLALDKIADLDDDNGNGLADLGEFIRWTFVVVNNGNVRLVDVRVEDPTAGVVNCPETELEPLQPTTCEAAQPRRVTEADILAGEITNTAVAHANTDPGGAPVVSPPDSTTTPTAPAAPALTLDKVATLNDLNDNDLADLGETIDYSFVIVNTGNVTLTNIEVTDPKVGPVTCPLTILAPSSAVTCSSELYTVTQADIDAGVVRNTAVARGTPPQGPPVETPPDSAEVPVADPGLTITKDADLNDTDGDALADVGETIDYSFVLTNTGNVPLTNVQVNDPKAGDVTCPAGPLAPGDSVTCTAPPYTVTDADIDAGVVRNVATGSGQPPGTGPPIVTPPVTVDVPVDEGSGGGGGGAGGDQPSLELIKRADLADQDGDGLADAGEEVTYTFAVTNTGDVELIDIIVNDPKISDITCPQSTLEPGASMICTAPVYVVTEADVESGRVYNVATATGTPGEGGEPVESPPSSVSIPVDEEDGASGGGPSTAGGGGASTAGGDGDGDGGLAYTGVGTPAAILGWALLFITSGATLLAASRRTRVTRTR